MSKRQDEYRQKQKNEGKKQVSIWVSKEDKEIIERFKTELGKTSYSETISDIINLFAEAVDSDIFVIKPATIQIQKRPSPVTKDKPPIAPPVTKPQTRKIQSAPRNIDIEKIKETYNLVLELKNQDMSHQNIADHLNTNSIETKSGTGEWTKIAVRDLITKPPKYLLNVL